jgi:hypothetical protein
MENKTTVNNKRILNLKILQSSLLKIIFNFLIIRHLK